MNIGLGTKSTTYPGKLRNPDTAFLDSVPYHEVYRRFEPRGCRICLDPLVGVSWHSRAYLFHMPYRDGVVVFFLVGGGTTHNTCE